MSWMDDMWEHPPIWVVHGGGAYFTDVNGHEYLDMYIADMSGFCGHAPALIAPPDEHAVVSGVPIGEVATGGTLFANALSMAAGRAALEEVLTEDAFELARNLGRRWPTASRLCSGRRACLGAWPGCSPAAITHSRRSRREMRSSREPKTNPTCGR